MHGEEMQTELRLPPREQKKAVQAYWIVEELVGAAQKDQAAWDELFYRNLTLQLSNYCYVVCGQGLTEEEKQGVFACLLSALPKKTRETIKAKHAPFAVRTAHRALMTSEYGLWKLQGKWFPLIA